MSERTPMPLAMARLIGGLVNCPDEYYNPNKVDTLNDTFIVEGGAYVYALDDDQEIYLKSVTP